MTLPLLLSVPHAGLEVPEPLASQCALTLGEIEEDGDVGAAAIYTLRDQVRAFATTGVARAVLDMNRAEEDRRKDGIVKTHTCWDVAVWREPLTEEQIEWLFAAYHRPYHAQLETLARSGVALGIDCHTMAAEGPPVGPDPGVERPAACLSDGEETCPREWTESIRGHLARSLGGEVTINEPFRGGYITRRHAAELPWMQLELSRAPFLSDVEKREAVLAALRAFADELP